MTNVPNKLRVIHYPQVPCLGFEVDVPNEQVAFLIKNALADQHLFLLDQKIIPDYSNAILVLMLQDGEWVGYYNDDEGMDWEEFESTYLIEYQ